MNPAAALITGICEEVGWTGFVNPRLRQRYSGLANVTVLNR